MSSCSPSRDNQGRPFDAPAAVRPSDVVAQNPYAKIESLQRGSASPFAAMSAVDVSARLASAQVCHVVIGGHAMAAYGRVRNTEDVDVIAVDMEHAASCIAGLYQGAAVHRAPGAIGSAVLAADGRKLADVLSYYGGAAFRHAIDTAQVVDGVSVPSRESLMALKFEAISSATRPRDKKAMDLSDLIYLVTRHRDQSGASDIRRSIGDIVEIDSCGDPLRGKARWEAMYDAILSGSPISI